jgi:hypothetical protein
VRAGRSAAHPQPVDRRGDFLMLSNEYLTDAQKLIRLASSHIKASMSPEDSIQGGLLFALGVEKLLKFTLAKINPIFVLKVSDFKHSAPSLYSNKIVSAGKNDEIDAKPNSDVITFRVSLSRSKVFSKTANKHSQMLFTLAHWRDVIAHRPTSELDLDKVGLMLRKDAIALIRDFSEEFDVSFLEFWGPESERLVALSQLLTNREKFEKEMTKKLEAHKKLWEYRTTNTEFISQADEITSSLQKQSGDNFSFEGVTCPACGKTCVVRIEPDYDYADGESYITGVYAEKLNCYYCSLKLETYDELAYVDVDGLLAAVYHECA